MAGIHYSNKYNDDEYEYRHVILPSNIVRIMPKRRLLTDAEWRALGVQQSLGWQHYAIYRPEPHILLFRRKLNALPPAIAQ
jgi:cyclin-dependent kinase regulatory subunit CKS1